MDATRCKNELLEKSIVENYEQWSSEVKLLREALAPFAKIDTRLPFKGLIPGALIKASDVERARKAMTETE